MQWLYSICIYFFTSTLFVSFSLLFTYIPFVSYFVLLCSVANLFMSVILGPHINSNRAIPSPSSRFHVSPRSFTGTNGYYQVNLRKADKKSEVKIFESVRGRIRNKTRGWKIILWERGASMVDRCALVHVRMHAHVMLYTRTKCAGETVCVCVRVHVCKINADRGTQNGARSASPHALSQSFESRPRGPVKWRNYLESPAI